MSILFLIPHPDLQACIRHYVYCEIGTEGKWSHSSMAPSGCASLCIIPKVENILIKENGNQPEGYEPITFIGQTTQFKKVSFYGRLKPFFVIFRPCGAYRLLGFHQKECKEICINLSDLLGPSLHRFKDDMEGKSRAKEIKSVVENFFLKQISSRDPESDHLAYTVEQIQHNCFNRSLIKSICRQEGYSMRTLERHMNKIVGVTPKKFQRIMRFNAALQYLEQHPLHYNASQIACRFGYFDQTHFIKEFKLFYGKTPAEYIAEDNRFLSKIASPAK